VGLHVWGALANLYQTFAINQTFHHHPAGVLGGALNNATLRVIVAGGPAILNLVILVISVSMWFFWVICQTKNGNIAHPMFI